MTLIAEKVLLASDVKSEPMPDTEPCSESPSSLEGNRQDETHTIASRVKRRVVTAARREQNKTAQRVYRTSKCLNPTLIIGC